VMALAGWMLEQGGRLRCFSAPSPQSR